MPAFIAIGIYGFYAGIFASAAYVSGKILRHNERVRDERKREFEELKASLKTAS